MRRMLLVGWCGFIAASGCAFVDQKARLDPDVRVANSTVGAGRRVVVAVVDERPRSLIGRRGAGGSVGGAITTDQDLAELVRGKVAEGLQRSGFAPVSADGAEAPKMKVEIRFLEYELAMGFWTGSINTRAALKAICRNGADGYERLYRAEGKRGAFVVPSASKNELLLNQTLSDALNKMLEDRELLGCLGR